MNTAVDCNDGNVCTTDACDAATGCKHTDNTAQCDDGNMCTVDTCDGVDGCENAPMPDCCVGDAMCAGSEPAGLTADFRWGCTVNSGPPTGTCVSCLDSDGDGWCDSPTESDCDNTFDEDGDGLVDCADADCDNDAACVVPCVPDCTGMECGDDGCGGSCGSCADGDKCNATFQCEEEPRLSITWTAPMSGVPQNAGGQLVLLAKCYDAVGGTVVSWGVKAYGPTASTSLSWTADTWFEPADCIAQVVEVVGGKTVWYANGLYGVLSYIWDGLAVTTVKGNGTSGWPFFPDTDSDGDCTLDGADACPFDGYDTCVP
ncbi:MAG: hypothetical protein A2821_02800 [Candidatus Magasanikbacteria bacterium RIFCSPHIGHO2_01_FULL_41_23]|uniref:Uncharacterized protein n=1 Tax=Candidatus Magasanikbacteria bacterium RIFCSPLOWO2_01_FULL_40_15 TaxID=1798686 RepID=A0A1F6N4F1_9BACT|nr:MAG: hypothetical protein A2821_02800 [Candidatus Magasanikbacteria bacterium RIFCSPHIGHO2_01_FULL_41_23]OGH67266.1 MAG: hypothetical protein A3C66_00815 [Candidatus Magasanikbacteria bacterium RIFCSPHIGHO2_02_FULL_41_35]OGH76491.1 MAG: hypothetical protein A3F22_00025 [Candidatus Magasanikbacteria bacterium RIFCSPHIGHO2_12_FULL_41_16]OGH78523.1 MAG: hypothetical protein A2983_03330 [Candidatus Magasanikbacteria bacterium RIFCSPLOWO2_01_FULL_40_15]